METRYLFLRNENGCYEIHKITPDMKGYKYAYPTQEAAIKSVYSIY